MFSLFQGIVPPLLQVLSETNRVSMKRNAVWALSNLCRGKNPPPDFAKVSPALPILAHLLFFNDTDVLADTCWALSYLSDGPNEKVQAVIGKLSIIYEFREILMWKFQDFSVIQILREIKFGESRSPKMVIFCHFWGSDTCFVHLVIVSLQNVQKIYKFIGSEY